MKVAFALLAVAGVLGLLLPGAEARRFLNAGAGSDDKKNFPVSKVVTLLRDMQKQLEKEADEDQEIFEKMDCWCKTYDRDKTQSVQDAETHLAELQTTIETSVADTARLQEEIKAHKEDLAKSQNSLDTATALREKQAAEFSAEEKDMLQSIQALDSAIVVLSKHYKSAALLEDGRLQRVLDVGRAQLLEHGRLLRGALTPAQRRLVLSLRQDPSKSATFRQASVQAYQPQSSEIFGILKQMKATFEENLSQTQKEEAANSKSYEGLKAAKEEEIHASRSALEQKTAQLAETENTHAHAKQDKDDTQKSLSADDTFLIDLKQKCAATRTEYDARVKMRGTELSAVAEAISILSSDEAADTFSKTFNPAFVQKRQKHRDSRRAAELVAPLLERAGRRRGDARLVALAIAARADPLAKVKQAIDKLVAELAQEKKFEIKKRDDCVARAHANELTSERYQREKTDLESRRDRLKSAVDEETAQVKTLTSEIEQARLQIKRKGEDRELENKEFQSVIADQRETQQLLQKALSVLKAVYSKKQVLLQARATPEPVPAGFETYGQSRGAGGVVAMIESIFNDAKAMEKEVIRDEQEAQKDYEDFIKDTNADIETKTQSIIHKNQKKSTFETDLVTTEADIKQNLAELDSLASTGAALKAECDFVVNNFDIRQEARDQEVEALKQAKAVLSGMSLD